ncbi:hypothetical protein [Aeoliella sp. SH292]|uniref:hypothetical protein n=1 Tax=Aeoliella sp. SH292 TaxID=3454464 RepID=UPI003F957952
MASAMIVQCLRRSFLLWLMATVATFASSALAVEIRTYEFLDTQAGRLRFGGGLKSGKSYARPEGIFEVTIDDNGTATLTRFDIAVTGVEIAVEGASPLIDGSPLINYLSGVNPVGLLARYDSGVIFSTYPSDVATDDGASFSMVLSSICEENISVSLRASPGVSSDHPGLSTELGLQARLVTVPEPASVLILVASSLLVICSRRMAT